MYKTSTLPHIHVVAGIIWKNTTFLATSRPENKSWAGYWEFPGGKIEKGESLEQALTRELKEELGIFVLKSQMWLKKDHSYDDVLVTLHFLHVTNFSGIPQPKEGQKLQWVSIAQAQNMPFLPADIPLLRKLTLPIISL